MVYKYKYELKNPNNRNSVNLLDHSSNITTAIKNVFGSSLISIKIHQKYYEFEVSNVAVQSDKQKVGKEIVKLDTVLNQLKADYSYSTQLFVEKI